MNAKQLYHQLLPFKDKNYYSGPLKWMLCSKSGTGRQKSTLCLFCGNIANNIGVVKFHGSTFNIPICNSHASDYLIKHKPKGWSFVSPAFIPMNLKFTRSLVIPDRPAPMQIRCGKAPAHYHESLN